MLRRPFARDLSGLTKWLLATVTLAVLSAMLAGYFPPRYAEAWSTSPTVNTPICTAPGDQGFNDSASDGSGGTIIAWADWRSGSNSDIYAQRVDAAGNVQWAANGVPICTATDEQSFPRLVSDGSGGVIIAWNDRRAASTTGWDIYAQKVDATGKVRWDPNGVPICTAAESQESPALVSDGTGGAIIAWHDYRNSLTTGRDVYAQRVDATGAVRWASDGVAICTAVYEQVFCISVSDGSGGAIIAWTDYRKGTDTDCDIYSQGVDATGKVKWNPDGVPICTADYEQSSPRLVSDGSGGAIITWHDYRDSSTTGVHIYAQRVDAAGDVQWALNGAPICTPSGAGQGYPALVSDGSGGAIIAWYDWRSGLQDIYAQRVNAVGMVQWALNGAPICTASSGQANPTLVSDGSGGAIIAWVDWRSGSDSDIYAQRVDGNTGATKWNPKEPSNGGVPICTATGAQGLGGYWFMMSMCDDGSGGGIIAWADWRNELNTGCDIYAQRVNASGALRSPPDTPEVQAPTPGRRLASGDGLQLAASVFHDNDGDSHAASQWQITTKSGDYSSPNLIYEDQPTPGSIAYAVPQGTIDLTKGTTYYWRVRYKDSYGEWSAWSEETSFSLDQPPGQPSNSSPANGELVNTLTPALSSSAFSDPDTGDAHAFSQWQLSGKQGDYSTPIHSSEETTQLISFTTPSGKLTDGTIYYWHVRYKDALGVWSAYSSETSFFVDTSAPTVTLNAAPDFTSDTATFTGSATDNLTAIDAVEYKLDTGAWNAASFTPASTDNKTGSYTLTVTALSDGAHALEVRARDKAVNLSARNATKSFTVDTVKPIITPQASLVITSKTTPRFSGTVTDDSPISLVQYRIDSGNWQAAEFAPEVDDPKSTEYSFTSYLSEGKHEVEVRVVDVVGKESSVVIAVTIESEGFPVWAIVLIALGGVLVIAGAGYLIWRNRGKIEGKAKEKVEASKQKLSQ